MGAESASGAYRSAPISSAQLHGGGGAADDDLVPVPFALVLEDVDDLLLVGHGRGHQGGGPDDVGPDALGFLDEGHRVDVDAQVLDLVEPRLEHQLDDVLADLVEIALDHADHHLSLGHGLVFGFQVGPHHADHGLKGLAGQHHLRKKDVQPGELLTDPLHGGREGGENVQGIGPRLQQLPGNPHALLCFALLDPLFQFRH